MKKNYILLLIIPLFFLLTACPNKNDPTPVESFTFKISADTSKTTFTSVWLNISLSSGNFSKASEVGFCIGPNPNPTISDSTTIMKSSDFSNAVSGLIYNKPYYLRGYAKYNNQVYYSDNVSVKTKNLDNTKWDFYYQRGNVYWHADLTFLPNNKLFYSEPIYGNLYDYTGAYTFNGNKISYDIHNDNSLVMTGTLQDNKIINGDWTYNKSDGTKNLVEKVWVATLL